MYEIRKKERKLMDQVKTEVKFPYLSDDDIHNLELSVLYRILGSFKASDSEIELIKQKRRRMQKLQFKHKKDLATKNFIKETVGEIDGLESEKKELMTHKKDLVSEIEHYKKMCLQQNN